MVFEPNGVYVGVLKVSSMRNNSYYMDAHIQDASGNVPIWESEGVLPLSLPGGNISYRTLSLPFFMVGPSDGKTFYVGFYQADTITEVLYDLSYVRIV